LNENAKSGPKSIWWWLGGALPALAGLFALVSPVGEPLRLFGFDALYLFRPAPDQKALGGVVVLKMDEESRAALHQDPNREWDRKAHGRLVEKLTEAHAKAVVFDVLFDLPSGNPVADLQLAEAIRQAGNVVLAAKVEATREAGRPGSSQVLCPLSLFTSNATWGVADWPRPEPGSAVIIRRQFNHADYTNLAWAAAVSAGNAPEDRLVNRWLNLYGPAGTLPTVSYHRALETNSLPPGFFAGKAVFIGGTELITLAGETGDFHSTPFSRWRGGQVSGVELQATAFLNLVHNEWLQECSPLMEFGLILVVGTALGFGIPNFRPWTGAAFAATFALSFGLAAFELAWTWHLWFPWLIFCVVQIPCALAWSIFTHTGKLAKENQLLKRSIALAESAGSLPAHLPGIEELPRPGGHSANKAAAAGAASSTVVIAGRPPPIPNHRLIRQIGRGSYGEVWIAQDEIGTYHAVKVVYQRSFSSADPYEREFRGIQKFTPISRNHPGFVHVLHVGRNDPNGYFFYIMELGDDQNTQQQINPGLYSPRTLATQLEGGRMPVPECVQLGLDLTAALQYLHDHQLVHRDIKPSNIIFVNRAPKFADIGLVTEIARQGKDATFVGTEGYLAPEGPGTVVADIYSLGKVLYEACTGRDRNEFPSLSSTLVVSEGKDLSAFNDIFLKACHPEVQNRYASASQMHEDLLKLREQLQNQKGP
jgi:CHASE2 domain-containing sensor protein